MGWKKDDEWHGPLWNRLRDGGLLRDAAELRRLFEAGGEDPEGEQAAMLGWLLSMGRKDLVDKLKRPLLEKAGARVVKNRCFRVVREPPADGILIGFSTDLDEDGAEVRLPVASLTRHVGVFGGSGVGKSHLVKVVLAEMIGRPDIVVLVFDPEGEYRSLLDLFPRERLWWLKPPDARYCIQINPFEPPVPTEAESWTGKITDLCRKCYYLRDGSATLFSAVLGELYLRRGCLRGSGNWPTLSNLLAHLGTLGFGKTSRSAGYLESLVRCVRAMQDSLGGVLNVVRGTPIPEMTKQSAIVDTSALDSIAMEFFQCLLLLKITESNGAK